MRTIQSFGTKLSALNSLGITDTKGKCFLNFQITISLGFDSLTLYCIAKLNKCRHFSTLQMTHPLKSFLDSERHELDSLCTPITGEFWQKGLPSLALNSEYLIIRQNSLCNHKSNISLPIGVVKQFKTLIPEFVYTVFPISDT